MHEQKDTIAYQTSAGPPSRMGSVLLWLAVLFALIVMGFLIALVVVFLVLVPSRAPYFSWIAYGQFFSSACAIVLAMTRTILRGELRQGFTTLDRLNVAALAVGVVGVFTSAIWWRPWH